ncbi:hypothetical protein JRG66_03925 [Salinimicrobium tongyeongense]|uniref:Addiction module component, TIGR02574 family n=1 Tax=Salinimicrobium tongyeongense TaxID=2809707 RepID=A0ABY6NTZ6_9FLAO|nr:hypothetical protein [Salinimicrobium tongyeongense]UZH56028.1 hypothetical protein JRG66_03925 [Salinimicrobium tongyeongense]
MTSGDLRNKVREYVDTADVRLLKMLEAIAETYENEANEPILDEGDYQILDSRREAHLKGESKSLSWEEVKRKIKSANS